MAGTWDQGEAYERFMGRWSRLLAPEFLAWLGAPPGLRWAELGCGTGALTASILDHAEPASIVAIDPAAGLLEVAAAHVTDPRVTFREGSVEVFEDGAADVLVSGLVLNFVPDPVEVVAAAARVAGTVAAYVWDYAGGVEMLSRFWDAASEVAGHPVAASEATTFAGFDATRLAEIWGEAGLRLVSTGTLAIEMVFDDLDDLWTPVLGGAGPAPAYVATLDADTREHVRVAMTASLEQATDGRIRLPARAWSVRGESRDRSR
ncbi:MAG: class I SAM-dependent methyltransferase [Marmoricola sp.]|nr:class I SAM-dependent methyltransferase [Marmoricola sp.]